jgi:hypothetical protein
MTSIRARRLRLTHARVVATLVGLGGCANLIELGPERIYEDGAVASSGSGAGADGGGGSPAGGVGGEHAGVGGQQPGVGGVGGAGMGGNGGGVAGAGGAGGADACSGAPILWASRFGDASRQIVTGAAPDGAGGVYLAGIFTGALDLGGGPLTSAGLGDMFVVRFDEDGNHLWSRRFGDAADQMGFVRPTRAADGVVLLGTFSGTVDFGDGLPVAGIADGFVARYDAVGGHVFSATIGGASADGTTGAVDATSGEIVVATTFKNQILDFDGTPRTSASADLNDVLIAKLDPSGGHLWSLQFGGVGQDSANSVDVDPAGRIVLAVSSNDHLDLGKGLMAHTSGTDTFVAVYEPDGDAVWTKAFGGPGVQDPYRVVVDPASGDLLLAGLLRYGPRAMGSTSFGGSTLTLTEGGYLARLDSAGEHLSSRAVSGVWPTRIAVDGAGNVLVGGPFGGLVDFGNPPIASEGKQDGVFSKLEPGLAHQWTLPFGSFEDDAVAGIAVDGTATAFVAGQFMGTVTLPGCLPLTSAGDADILLMKVDLGP